MDVKSPQRGSPKLCQNRSRRSPKMKKGAPKQHLVKRPYPGGVQTLFMSTVSQFGLFLGVPGALKKQPK